MIFALMAYYCKYDYNMITNCDSQSLFNIIIKQTFNILGLILNYLLIHH